MPITDVLKTLSNDYRYQILLWLKNPALHFGEERLRCEETGFCGGICVGLITEKSGLAQSVVSGYLTGLKNAGLVESKRIGKWTYYRYHAEGVAGFLNRLQEDLS
ncbi:ArsR/SmtB family transcription factor [Neisseria perflava]|uniref:ArsR/SmtB family transcription factor n=1 Tax=Neisseria perflava TaxID=33053 RepID=UPI00209E4895|nr:transcriptional regulator [Neisseria perflava]MCP1660386.1 DNA-binding transcriptional ArsR family regulator [Neisseria perflava]